MSPYTAAARKLVRARHAALPVPVFRAYLAGCTSKKRNAADDTPLARLKLVILDLNGTLVFRENGARSSNTPIPRPGLRDFCKYLFDNFAVMVWSSAQPQSVLSMCANIFSHEQREQLVAVWARDTLGLTPEQYNSKCQTSKNLEQVWRDPHLRKIKRFSQRDTIIIDDSKLKVLAHPHNLIEVPEFSAERVARGTDDALREVTAYLETLRKLPNVSAYIKHSPLRFADKPRKVKKPKNRLKADTQQEVADDAPKAADARNRQANENAGDTDSLEDKIIRSAPRHGTFFNN
ncbi:HAD-like domain-containing protein [Protomyces lactucae-debilis]|uniref:Mitochondrial import inner membrane translocase subunit TIM50 n=1 Tax=Protomyces lactucae-debilis TaxID=2754530 RepID=A0A1Y2FSD2_PROLT|nr:HAD-like domain-containing protein [Protomyces lactucae-debilis]ORY86859.1 HAD-like domain-containing protein [Protomyces lactucae-debilis]